jgi:hypothetical protein
MMVAFEVQFIYDGVCHAEGFHLLLAKGCDRNKALNPCKKNILCSFRYKSFRQLFMLDQESGSEATLRWVRRQFLTETRPSKLKGKTGTIIKKCFDKIF